MNNGNLEESEASVLIEALKRKGANGPCPRCKNNSFTIVDMVSPMYMVFCKNCGLKFEHWSPILFDPNTTNTSDIDENEEGNKT